jgi:hypothetical protein
VLQSFQNWECASTIFTFGIACRIRMKRRWKVCIALVVVGLAGFLVWAFLSPATPPVTVHFLPYELFHTSAIKGRPPYTNGVVTAVFVVSNTTPRVLSAHAVYYYRFKGTELKNFAWFEYVRTGSVIRSSGDIFLTPGQTGTFRAGVPRAHEPIRTVVEGRDVPLKNAFLARWRDRLPWNRYAFSITVTNEPPPP